VWETLGEVRQPRLDFLYRYYAGIARGGDGAVYGEIRCIGTGRNQNLELDG
jgi:hypothetical protein